MDIKSLINKGLIRVYLPLVFFVITCVIIGEFLMLDDTIIALILLVSVIIGWVWWSYQIVKWKCWAFSKVRKQESHDLYIKAIGVGLIWEAGSVFNKTEIWTAADKIKWSKLDPEIQKIFGNYNS